MKLYTALEAAKLLHCHSATVGKKCTAHKIGLRHGNTWLLTEDDLVRLRAVIQDGKGWPSGKPRKKPPPPA